MAIILSLVQNCKTLKIVQYHICVGQQYGIPNPNTNLDLILTPTTILKETLLFFMNYSPGLKAILTKSPVIDALKELINY